MDKSLLPWYNRCISYETMEAAMPISLLPKHITGETTDLTVEFLKNEGIRLLMLDFDNTIVPYTTSTPTEAMD